ncbi:NAPDH-dependent diflavin reductase [Maudiozyma exigua]|uniref:NADPH-dependent diflavin oxidoreductase 1 n=1 Tax=Maudiozyma exigua TaxID=34358 RepID=A0A9P6WCG9_MAUEX|nr:NAPDH-dependent diflavin reductase [Kazachstania exigua]
MAPNKIAILYGSETGNTEDFAKILSYKLQRLHYPHTLSTIGDFNPQDILGVRYLFVLCATTGQGELPRNCHEHSFLDKKNKTLWSVLKRKNIPEDFLKHINVAFFGLGDSSYPKFNYAIRKLHTRIVGQLGANEIFDRLEADEQSMAGSNKGTGAGVESVYFEYEKRVLEYLMTKFPKRKVNGQSMERNAIDDSIYLQPKSYLCLADKEDDSEEADVIVNEPLKFSNDAAIKYGKVIKNLGITAKDHFQDVREFIFTNNDTNIKDQYEAGDTASIFPCNSDTSVQQFLETQDHWLPMADKPLKFTNDVPNALKSGGVIEPLTLRNILKYHCDITCIPRTSFFMKIWMFATDVSRMERGEGQLEQQRDKLKEFATDQDMQELYDYCNRPRRSILEVIEDFLSLRLPWEYCLDYLPLIKPLYYSISSGPNDSNVQLTVAIVKYKTMLRKIRTGICTDYIGHLKEGDIIRYNIHNNHLIQDQYKGNPMVLVSPGVGIAPLLSIIKEEPQLSKNLQLFFGCRFKDKDYIYGETLERWDKEGRITLHPVFSRDRENSPDTKYVQDVLWKLGSFVTDLLVKEKALFVLCGASGKMPIQVRLTVIEMLKKWGGFETDEAAAAYLKEMEKEDRYLQETW